MLSLRKNRFLLLLFLVFLLLIPLIVAIFVVDNKINPKSNLKGYEELITKLETTTKANPKIAETPAYEKMINSLRLLETNNLDKEKQRETFYNAKRYLVETYDITKENKLYQLQVDFNDFAIANFPNPEKNFKPICLDPKCAPPESEEITNVIAEIQTSDLPDYLKESYIANITNSSYLTDDPAGVKAGSFLADARMIRNDPEFKKLGLSEKIAAEIESYLRKAFPQEYEILIKEGTITPIDSK